jgi:hypothetical protein
MTTYREIHGRSIKAVSTDPTGDITEGEIWYNTTSDTFKSVILSKTYSSSANMSNPTGGAAGFGIQTSAVRAGGETTTASLSATEEYSGYSWSTGGALPAIQYQNDGAGTLTAGLSIGGFNPPPGHSTDTLEYDGSSWTAGGAMPSGRFGAFVNGIQTAALCAGGDDNTPGYLTGTLEYDGSSWTTGGALNLGKRQGLAAGTQTAAIAAGGRQGPGPTTADNQLYDGSTWTTVNSMNTAKKYLAGFGTQTATIGAGGYTTTNTTQTEEWDGTNWIINGATLATARGMNETSGNAPADAGVTFGGTGSLTAATEEYNSTINTITQASWASGGALNTGRYGLRGTGTQTSMVVAGGNIPPNSNSNATEEYDGSSWTNSTNLPAVIQDGNMTGTESASIYSGGSINPGSNPGATNHYNGSSWTAGGNTVTDVNQYALTGTSTAAVAFGGYITTGPGRTNAIQNYDGSSWTSNPVSLPANRGLMRSAGTQTACILVGGNNPPGSPSQPIDSLEWDGSSISTGPNNIVGMNDHGGWGTSTEAYFMGGDQPTGTGGTGPKAVATFYYNGTAFTSVTNMTTGKNTFGFSKSANEAGLICGGNSPSPHQSTTEEFTPETTAINVKTLTQS